MVANYEYDLARPLASALRAKAPYVGIPIPGHAPLIFPRRKLQGALCGVKPIHIAVVVHENGARSLAVDGVAGKNCRTSMRMLSIPRERFRNRSTEEYKAIAAWNPVKADKPRVTKYDKALAKVEKELANLGKKPTVFNPCMRTSQENDYVRATFLRWHQQKALRRRIGALAVQAHKGDITARQMYTALAEFTTVKRYSDYTAKQLERKGIKVKWGHDGFHLYSDPKNLWRFLPDLVRDYSDNRPRLYYGTLEEWRERQAKQWGAAHYQSTLEWSHARTALLSEMEAIRAMAAATLAAPALRVEEMAA